MVKPAESVALDDDVQEDRRSVERGIADLEAGRVRTTEELLVFIEEQRRARR